MFLAGKFIELILNGWFLSELCFPNWCLNGNITYKQRIVQPAMFGYSLAWHDPMLSHGWRSDPTDPTAPQEKSPLKITCVWVWKLVYFAEEPLIFRATWKSLDADPNWLKAWHLEVETQHFCFLNSMYTDLLIARIEYQRLCFFQETMGHF